MGFQPVWILVNSDSVRLKAQPTSLAGILSPIKESC